MFTGIITDIGTLVKIDRDSSGSHAGACMTVVEKEALDGGCQYAFDVSDESLDKTTLKYWVEGQLMNLERAMTASDELGGHLVSGHVDQVGELAAKEAIAGSIKLTFNAPSDLMAMIAPKGSITIDGVSLTVNRADSQQFNVNIIPHTAEVTTLGQLQVGDKVNLEIDLIARYVTRYLSQMKDKS